MRKHILFDLVKRSLLLPALSVVAYMVLPCLAAGAENSNTSAKISTAKVSDGYLLKGQDGLGNVEIYASREGAKFNYPRADYCVMTAAPRWDVTWYSKGGGTMYSESMKVFWQSKGRSIKTTESKIPPLKYDYAGMKAARFSVPLSGEASVELGPILPNKTAQKTYLLRRDFYVMGPIALPREVLSFINNFYDTPDADTLPLGVHKVSRDGRENKVFYVTSVQKCKLSSELYKIPPGLKLVPNQRNVVAGAGYQQDFDDLARSLKMGESFGSH